MISFQKPKKLITQITRSSWWSFKVFFELSPKHTIGLFTATFLVEILSVVNVFIFAKAIDILLQVYNGGLSNNYVYFIVLLFFLLSIVRNLLYTYMEYSKRAVRIPFRPKFQEKIYNKLIELGIPSLEDPDTNNLIERTSRNSNRVTQVFFELNSFFSSATVIVTSGSIIFFLAPQLIVIYVLVLIPSVVVDRIYLKRLWDYEREVTEDSRKAYEASTYLRRPVYLLELLITRGYRKLSNYFESFMDNWLVKLFNIRREWFTRSYLVSVIRYTVDIYANILIFFRFVNGAISIGDVTFYMRQVSDFTNNVSNLNNRLSNLYEASLSIDEAMEFFNMSPAQDGNLKIEKMTSGPRIIFENVTFRYPNSQKDVIKNLNLDIRSNEKIAIVGHNGAGKTTLTKLILRFYRTTKGNILVNSNELNEINIDSYYKNVSAMFQEYNTYGNLTAAENIAIGDLDLKPNKNRIKKAAQKAQALGFIEEYPDNFDQLMSERYKGGTRPSTGQWQKIAIARFFYRNSPLVIFDEPTAAIDAEAEAKIFNRIYKFFKKKTVIIISHRFSTVRNADRIIVFEKGKIVEQGTHEELLKLKGKYFKSFNLQAKGYR